MSARLGLVWIVLLGLSVARAADAPATAKPVLSGAVEALHPFNQTDYLLVFDALTNARDLERAFQLASEAVKQLPRDMSWRLKLARICDWTERPLEAAKHWTTLFQSGSRSQETIQAMLRLLPLMDDTQVALQVWAFKAQQRPLSEQEWRAVYALYESTAQPKLGSVHFENQYRQLKHPYLLELAAILADHAEDAPRAFSLYAERSVIKPFSLDMLLRAVVSLVRQDRMPEALAFMQTHAHQVNGEAHAFWQMLSEVAWEQQALDSAQTSYERLVQLPQATKNDWERLIFLVRQNHPDQAASLALQAYRRFGTADLLMQSLWIYAEAGNFAAQARALKSLSTHELAQAERITPFLLIRAQLHRNDKQPGLAWQDLQRALLLDPDSDDVGVNALWFLIQESRANDVAALMRQRAQRAASTPSYWLAFAAANQLLDRHSEAVRWYAKEVKRQPDAPLVLLNYADAMERTGQAGMAARVRRHAWLLLKQKYPQPEDFRKLSRQPELLAWARLAILNSPGDPGLDLVKKLVVQTRLDANESADEQTLALVLGWAILKDQSANARAWMWSRYAKQTQLSAPLWGQVQVALQLKDTKVMTSLLERSSAGLPIYNRYDTAYELGQIERAQDIAFHGMSRQDGDEPLHDRYRVHVPSQANYVQIQLGAQRQGSTEALELQFETRLVLSPKLHLVLKGSRTQLAIADPALSSLSSGLGRLQSLEARWHGAKGPTRLVVATSDDSDALTGLRFSQTLQLGDRTSMEALVDYRVESTLSEPLRLGGLESAFGVNLNYALGKREYIRFSPRIVSFTTRAGDYLGSGHSIELEIGHRIRTDYPDWRVRAFANYQLYDRTPNNDPAVRLRLPQSLQTSLAESGLRVSEYFIPIGSTTVGSCLGMGQNVGGQNLQLVYSRAFRPYFDTCLVNNTSSGVSFNGLLGLAGSVTGEDHLSVHLQNSKSANSSGASTQLLILRYRHYY